MWCVLRRSQLVVNSSGDGSCHGEEDGVSSTDLTVGQFHALGNINTDLGCLYDHHYSD